MNFFCVEAQITVTQTKQEYDRQRKAAKRAAERDISIPDVADPDRRRQLEESDTEWMRFYFPDVFYNPFTEDQLKTLEDVSRVLEFGTMKCKADQRGGGKSTLVKYLLLKYSLERKVMFPLIIAATNGKAKKTSDSIRGRLASMQATSLELADREKKGGSTKGLRPNFFADDYPLECHVARIVEKNPVRGRNITANGMRPISVKWGSADGFFIMPTWEDEEPVGPIFMSLSWSSDELQGCNILDRRPDAVILDDLDSRDSLAAEDGKVSEKIEEVIDKTIAGLGGQSRRLGQYYICTITSEDAAAAKYSDPKIKPEWDGERVAAIKQWPIHMDKWDKYITLRQKGIHGNDKFARKAHQFYIDNREPNVSPEESMDYGAIVSNPHRFDSKELPDGTQNEISNLQFCFNYIAKTNIESFNTEFQNKPPPKPDHIEAKVSPYIVSTCADDDSMARRKAQIGSEMIVGGVDVRKIELHYSILTSGPTWKNYVPDYSLTTHGTSETTVEMAEKAIVDGLDALADDWEENPITDREGNEHSVDLTLIDAGWKGKYKEEDGTEKTWVTQPVETFCMKRGLRRWLPAMGVDTYRPKDPSRKYTVGDNWYIEHGWGTSRKCSIVFWRVSHWRGLIEELFMLPDADPERFKLFHPPSKDHWRGHKSLGEHIRAGAEEMAISRSGKRVKKKYRRDHWWDSFAMMLVARSVESKMRQMQANRKPRQSLSQMARKAKDANK